MAVTRVACCRGPLGVTAPILQNKMLPQRLLGSQAAYSLTSPSHFYTFCPINKHLVGSSVLLLYARLGGTGCGLHSAPVLQPGRTCVQSSGAEERRGSRQAFPKDERL